MPGALTRAVIGLIHYQLQETITAWQINIISSTASAEDAEGVFNRRVETVQKEEREKQRKAEHDAKLVEVKARLKDLQEAKRMIT